MCLCFVGKAGLAIPEIYFYNSVAQISGHRNEAKKQTLFMNFERKLNYERLF